MIRSAWKTPGRAGIPRPPAAALALALASLLSACITPGSRVQPFEPLAPEEITPPPPGQARIVASHQGGLLSTQSVKVTCLDGKSLFTFWNTTDYPREVVVAPGRHYLSLKVFIQGFDGSVPLWLDAEPNHFYEVRTEAHFVSGFGARSGFKAVLVDHATGQVVGGITGGQPPTDKDPPQCGA